MWVAKMKIVDGTIIEKELSPRFDDVHACFDYISRKLCILEYLAEQMQKFIDCEVDNKLVIRMGSYIRPYNIEQKRFVDGFDL